MNVTGQLTAVWKMNWWRIVDRWIFFILNIEHTMSSRQRSVVKSLRTETAAIVSWNEYVLITDRLSLVSSSLTDCHLQVSSSSDSTDSWRWNLLALPTFRGVHSGGGGGSEGSWPPPPTLEMQILKILQGFPPNPHLFLKFSSWPPPPPLTKAVFYNSHFIP